MSRAVVGFCTLVVLTVIGLTFLGGVVGTADATATAENASLGADISSFMQASSAETTGEIDDVTFDAALNQTDDRAEQRALIEERQERLEERRQRLQAQRATLGETPDVRNRSVATRIAVGASGLERSVNGTERAATNAGVDTDRLAEIRSDARSIRGPEIAGLARGIAGPPGKGSGGSSDGGFDRQTGSERSSAASGRPDVPEDSRGADGSQDGTRGASSGDWADHSSGPSGVRDRGGGNRSVSTDLTP